MWFVASVMPDRLMQSLVDLLLAHQDEIETVAVAYSQVAYPRENAEFLLEYLQDSPFEVVLVKDYPLEIDDLSPLILELKELNPDAFIGLTVAPDAFLLTEQAIQYGFDPKVFEILIGPAIPAYLDMFGPAVDGILFMTTYSPDGPWPGAREMHDRYVERFGERPDYLNTAEAYQAAQVIEQAVEAVGLDWGKLREHISTSEFMTVKGLTKFEGAENVGRPPSWAQWSDGKLNLVWPESEAMADFIFPKPNWP